jgi:hypothetical protein
MKVWAIKIVLAVIGITLLNLLTRIGLPSIVSNVGFFVVLFLVWKLKIGEQVNPSNESEHVAQLDGFAGLTQQLDYLGTKQAIMPIEMFQLANSFVEHSDSKETIDTLTDPKYANHKSLYVRRVAIIALRRKAIFDDQRVIDLMYDKLSDPVGWVAYDAAWYFKEAKINQEKIVVKLTELAGDKINLNAEDLKKISDENLSDDKVRLQIEATEALRSILG